MRKDWTKRTILTGLCLSCTALMLHVSELVPMHGINPLSYSGCVTSQTHLLSERGERAPWIGNQSPVVLVRDALPHDNFTYSLDLGPAEVVLMAPGIILEVSKTKVIHAPQVLGPFPYYGLDKETSELVVRRTFSGAPARYPLASVTAIRIINTGNTRSMAGYGALAGGATGLAAGFGIPLIVDGRIDDLTLAIGSICGGVLAGAGLVGGTVYGGFKDIDGRYEVRKGAWKFEGT